MSTLSGLNNEAFTEQQLAAIREAIAQIRANASAEFRILTQDERRRYGSIGEQNKLFVNKVHDYAVNRKDLCSPDVNWDDFEDDYKQRPILEEIIAELHDIANQLENAKMLHDFDNYQDALDDYAYTRYKATTSPGYANKLADLKQFFKRSKPTNNKE